VERRHRAKRGMILHVRAKTGTRIEDTARLADLVEGSIRQTIPSAEMDNIRLTYTKEMSTHSREQCIDGDGTDLSEPSAAGQHLELYRRASDPRDLLRRHGSVGALDEASAQRRHGGRPLITHVSPQETNKCASSQTLS